jgi:hypothetical protein
MGERHEWLVSPQLTNSISSSPVDVPQNNWERLVKTYPGKGCISASPAPQTTSSSDASSTTYVQNSFGEWPVSITWNNS